MTKVRFINIGKDLEGRTPIKEFKAIKLSKRDKETLFPNWTEEDIRENKVLYPQTDTWDDKSVFICGLGAKKFTKTNWVIVPAFSGEIEDWDEYIKKYGYYCLFYSISGYDLRSMDCCVIPSQHEFYSLLQCAGGIKKYQRYVDLVLKIQAIQAEKIKEMLPNKDGWSIKHTIDECLFRPYFALYSFVMSPYLDTIHDDDKMEKLYRIKRSNELREKHPLYNENKRLIEEMRSIRKEYGDTEKLWALEDKENEIWKKITTDVEQTLDKEINVEENGVFPVCMSDRMKLLFGEKCNRLYQIILDEFQAD